MGFNLLLIFCFLSLVPWATSQDSPSSPELYWQSKLPNVPIPEAITKILTSGSLKRNGSYRATGEGGIDLSPKALTCCFCNYWICGGSKSASVFFTKQELRKGNIMTTLDLTKTTNSLPLLSRSFVESIPFSLDKFPEILDRFSVASGSTEAKVLNNTIQLCETAEENKVCMTSLESLADFIKFQVGDEGTVISTEPKVQRYRLVEVVTKVAKEEGEDTKTVVSCHKLNYAYAVFYCHKVHNVSAYMVKLVGVEDETPVTAVAVCHMVNNAVGRKLGFIEDNNMSSGTTICHFLPQDHFIVYKSNNHEVDTINV